MTDQDLWGTYTAVDGVDFEALLAALDKSLEQRPNDPDAIKYRAYAYWMLNRLDDAINEYRLAISLDSTYYDGFCWIAGIYQQMGCLDESVQAISHAIAMDRTNEQFLLARAAVYRQMGQLSLAMIDESLASEITDGRRGTEKQTMKYENEGG